MCLAARSSDDNPIATNFFCKRPGCCDQHEWCKFWASVGECKQNAEWMEANCQVSCNTCHSARDEQIQNLKVRSPEPRTRANVKTSVALRRKLLKQRIENKKSKKGQKHSSPKKKAKLQNPKAQVANTKVKVQETIVPRVHEPAAIHERCRRIQNESFIMADLMWRENLVIPTEDNTGRTPLSVDDVVRSNIAHACVPRMDEAECERSLCYNLYYRTMDGTCNNLKHPLRGAAFRPYNRLMPPDYDDGLGAPVASIKQDRPNPRDVTRNLISSRQAVLHHEYNALLMQWGQFLIHDMAKTTLVPSAKCHVCQNISGICMMVPLASDEPNEGFKKEGCIRISRSSAICGSGNRKPRQQLNENTCYIDGSPIYGSSVADQKKTREGNTGFLKIQKFNGIKTLPFDTSKCRSRENCSVVFLAGDSRVNLFMGLTSFHLLLTLEHNRIATALHKMNPKWNGERLYHEARKIVGGEIHAVTYREYLPKILGSAFAGTVGEYHGYDPHVDATIVNEFNAGGFRFGHGMIQEFYPRLDRHNRNTSFGGYRFVDGTLHSDHFVFEGGVDPVIRGMMFTPVKRPQRITTTVTEKMFGSTDLSTINIQRGRDHGLPSYNEFRRLCGLRVARVFDDVSLCCAFIFQS
ncbi:hypothetical protein AB6A40_000033 [Gnathostoma spinigerum]|uniref:peroxidase n=1 Tax=Gnathostoma spinigerum TaxID=75299 RepID=A0ABD6E7G2_9BILA